MSETIRTGTPTRILGRIWLCSGRGSLSGQNRKQEKSGSEDTSCTLPPTLNARPDGVRICGILCESDAGIWGTKAPAKRGDGTCAGLIVRNEVLGAVEKYKVEGRGQPQPMQLQLRLGSLG
jgi:hypothetical protein